MSRWWSRWHHHADWSGLGNLGWNHRREHLRALGLVFAKLAASAASSGLPFQAWIIIDLEDAEQDAVYLHTPNPRSEFPFRLEEDGLTEAEDPALAAARAWRPGLERLLLETFRPLLAGHALRVTRVVGYWQEEGAPPRVCTSFYVTSSNVGQPLA